MDQPISPQQQPAPQPKIPPPPIGTGDAMPQMICPQCHLPIRPEYYFCPNCGASLHKPPLSTSMTSQILLYAFSAVLPWIAYLAITKWDGIKYIRSGDQQARAIGWIALIILVVSSIIAFWLTTVWIEGQVNSALNSVGNLSGGGLY